MPASTRKQHLHQTASVVGLRKPRRVTNEYPIASHRDRDSVTPPLDRSVAVFMTMHFRSVRVAVVALMLVMVPCTVIGAM